MRVSDIPSGNQRSAEAGLCWEEVISGATGTVEVLQQQPIRIRSAAAAVTVTVDGVLAATLTTNEVLLMNAGDGNPDDSKPTITVAIAGGNAYMQVARMWQRISKEPM